MSNLTNFAENRLVDHLFRNQALGNPATWHVALFTAVADAEAGTVTEIATGSYARAAIACSLANFAGTQGAGTTVASTGTGGATSNNGVITFPAPTANWGQATHIGLYDASTSGNAWIIVALTTPKTINNGDPAPTFPAASLGITVA
jgi:hypothetical protein